MLGNNYSANTASQNKPEGFSRNNSAITLLSKQQSVCNLVSLASSNSMSNQNATPNSHNAKSSTNELWYKKMRQIFLIEYSKYFESRGFIHLRDDRPADAQVRFKSIQNKLFFN